MLSVNKQHLQIYCSVMTQSYSKKIRYYNAIQQISTIITLKSKS